PGMACDSGMASISPASSRAGASARSPRTSIVQCPVVMRPVAKGTQRGCRALLPNPFTDQRGRHVMAALTPAHDAVTGKLVTAGRGGLVGPYPHPLPLPQFRNGRRAPAM